jgi:hypothetical protein
MDKLIGVQGACLPEYAHRPPRGKRATWKGNQLLSKQQSLRKQPSKKKHEQIVPAHGFIFNIEKGKGKVTYRCTIFE